MYMYINNLLRIILLNEVETKDGKIRIKIFNVCWTIFAHVLILI